MNSSIYEFFCWTKPRNLFLPKHYGSLLFNSNICLDLTLLLSFISVDFVKYNLWMLGIVLGLIALLALSLVIKKYRGNNEQNSIYKHKRVYQ